MHCQRSTATALASCLRRSTFPLRNLPSVSLARASSTASKPAMEPRPAATVLALAPLEPQQDNSRDSEPSGRYQIFMVQRSLSSKFFPGAHVFPGGVVDHADSAPHWKTLFEDANYGPELAYRVASIRETFEETGMLLTTPQSSADRIPTKLLEEWREKVYKEPSNLFRCCVEHGVAPAVRSLMLWSRWITPKAAPRRYDTLFYLAPLPRLPTGAVHDDGETIASEWFTPDAALEALSAGRISLPPPTYMTLRQLAEYPTFESLRKVCEEAVESGGPLPGQVQPHDMTLTLAKL